MAREKQGLLTESQDAYQRALENYDQTIDCWSIHVAQVKLKLAELSGALSDDIKMTRYVRECSF
jgi:hypothetical protein